jgi:hypothetical protein
VPLARSIRGRRGRSAGCTSRPNPARSLREGRGVDRRLAREIQIAGGDSPSKRTRPYGSSSRIGTPCLREPRDLAAALWERAPGSGTSGSCRRLRAPRCGAVLDACGTRLMLVICSQTIDIRLEQDQRPVVVGLSTATVWPRRCGRAGQPCRPPLSAAPVRCTLGHSAIGRAAPIAGTGSGDRMSPSRSSSRAQSAGPAPAGSRTTDAACERDRVHGTSRVAPARACRFPLSTLGDVRATSTGVVRPRSAAARRLLLRQAVPEGRR